MVLEKTIEDDIIKLVCQVPCEKLADLQQFQILEIILDDLKYWGIIIKKIKKDNLITLAVKNSLSDTPLKIEPLIVQDVILDFKKLGRALPPLIHQSMKKVLITVDGFWFCLVNPVVDYLQSNHKEIIIIGRFSAKNLQYLASVKGDKIIPVEELAAIKDEIYTSDADTLICLNTPLIQRKITAFMWSERINKSLIAVNNQWL